MKRLKNKLLSMESDTAAYKAMYEGSMRIEDPAHPTMEPYVDYSSIYYNESVGFEITTTHKLAQDKPTVVISILVSHSESTFRKNPPRMLRQISVCELSKNTLTS